MDELGLNLPVLIAQLVNFFLLLILLRIFLYKPILEMLGRRKQRIQEGEQAAEQSKAQASQAEAEVSKQIEDARQQSRELVAQAQEASARIQDEARTQARREAETMLERARSEIQLERDQAITELRSEFADLTVNAAEKVIGQSLDRSAHQRLIDEVLAESTFGEN
jgi:F-type H+-transporting ATPase subunit b